MIRRDGEAEANQLAKSSLPPFSGSIVLPSGSSVVEDDLAKLPSQCSSGPESRPQIIMVPGQNYNCKILHACPLFRVSRKELQKIHLQILMPKASLVVFNKAR